MSWPTDGKPRFVVVETMGDYTMRGSGGPPKIPEPSPRTVAVLDRAFCHRAVYVKQSERLSSQGIKQSIAKAQRLAREKCDELNAA